MSNYIVLIKQVPDISQITDNAFNHQTGTLMRNKLPNVVNELDAQALGLAHRMREISGDKNSRVAALSMGPESAADVLEYALSRIADTAVLLCDRALSGADTWATAAPLALAIRKIARDIFKDDKDFYIISGMQSVDGDTAQVPAQIACELQAPCIAYVTGADFNGEDFEFTRIVSGGSQLVTPKSMPAVITTAKYEYPLFASLKASRDARKTDIVRWNADDIGAEQTGVAGSKTQVIEIFPPGETKRKRKRIQNVKEFARLIIDSAKEPAQSAYEDPERQNYILPSQRDSLLQRDFEITEKELLHYKILTDKLTQMGIADVSRINESQIKELADCLGESFHEKTLQDMLKGLSEVEPSYKGEVWVVAELAGDNIHSSTFELLGKARELGDSLRQKVAVVVSGSDITHHSDELICSGADIVYLIEDPLLDVFEPGCFQKALSALIGDRKPQIVLFSATPRGRVLAPMTAYGLGCGLTADCTSLKIGDLSRRGDIAILMQTRPALGGNIMATIYTKNSFSQMVTVRPGVMKRLPPDGTRIGEVTKFPVRLSESDIASKIVMTEKSRDGAELDAELIVCGGKGMQSRDNYERLITELTQAMSDKLGLSTERGATRAAVEQGFIDRPYQIGQSGTSVGAKIYLGLGVSGAIQHMIGISNTQTIFAVNNDPEAPIFKQCDYYMIDSVEKVVPELIELLNSV
jgi:electron transfer flavoprotein alpha subunit